MYLDMGYDFPDIGELVKTMAILPISGDVEKKA
jgi:hypothetical protein